MPMNASIHRITTVEARSAGGTAWLGVVSSDGSYVNLFMPYETAQAMAVAFEGATALEAARRAEVFTDILNALRDLEFSDDAAAAVTTFLMEGRIPHVRVEM
jgi:hypothetical protein